MDVKRGVYHASHVKNNLIINFQASSLLFTNKTQFARLRNFTGEVGEYS
jgi:hypothetical protein